MGYTKKDIENFVDAINQNQKAMVEIEDYTDPDLIKIRKDKETKLMAERKHIEKMISIQTEIKILKKLDFNIAKNFKGFGKMKGKKSRH